jgi:hypothetical protein
MRTNGQPQQWVDARPPRREAELRDAIAPRTAVKR